MTHPLSDVINAADGFVLIGDSGAKRFPAMSYNVYTKTSRRFFCLDMGGRTVSRGAVDDGIVYASVSDLPADRGDLAIVWVHPHRAREAVDLTVEAGCRRVWFSFKTGHRDAVAHAPERGLEVVEIGRCPVHYLQADGIPWPCRAHTTITRLTGTWKRPPQTDSDAKRRELW